MDDLDDKYKPKNTPITRPRKFVSNSEVDRFDFPTGRLNYSNFTKTARPYAAVVSLSREQGTFSNIQEAIYYVSRIGGGTVFIRNGTYFSASDIVIPSDVTVVGESGGGVIINFDFAECQVRVQGTLVYNTGTVAAVNQSSTVVGTGTSWNSSMIDSYILLNGAFYLIANVTDATHLALATDFSGDNITGATYYIANPVGNANISNLTIEDSTHTNGALYYIYALGVSLSGITILTSLKGLNFVNSDGGTFNGIITDFCGSGIIINNSANTSIDTLVINNCTIGDGFSITSVNAFSLFNFGIFNSAGRGIILTSSFNYGIINFSCLSNTGVGIELVSTNDGNILSGDILNNATDGIKLTSGNLRNTMTNLIIRSNGGWGINVANANDVDNLILGNVLRTNTSGAVTDSGTTTKIRSNIGAVDN